MLSWSFVEEHSSRLVKSLKADPVLLVKDLIFQHHHLTFVVEFSEPLGLFWKHSCVVFPHPKSEIFYASKSCGLTGVFNFTFIIQAG